MTIKTILPAIALAFGIAAGICAPETASGRNRQKVVYKHKRVHHKHRVGLRHIGRGTKTTNKVKVEH